MDFLQGAIAQQEGLANLDIARLHLAQRAQGVDTGEEHQSEHASKAGQQRELRSPL